MDADTGVPIRLQFSQSIERERTAKKYGLDTYMPTVLMMGGGCGMIGDGSSTIREFDQLPQPVEFIIVCGHHEKFRKGSINSLLIKRKRIMKPTCIILISTLLVYTIIPTLMIRLFGIGVYKKGTDEQPIALTFDDGPDPEYTPLLLDLLKKHNIKATFFVLGRKAEKYPDLIKRIHNEGHLVGIHNYLHWSNALMTPKTVREQVNNTANVIDRIIGERTFYYRPPWGVINLFDFFLMKQYRMILWSVIVGDWKSSGGKRKIKQRLLSKLKGGAIIVLHDSGQTFGADRDAPAYMLEALSEFITEALHTGYSFHRVDEKMAA